VIFFARYEAGATGSTHIEEEHLLLALLRQDETFLRQLYLEPGKRQAIEAQIRSGLKPQTPIEPSADLPLSPSAKRVLAYGAEEAERRQRHIQPAHLLSALLRENGRVAGILATHGVTREGVRAAMDHTEQTSAVTALPPKPLHEEFEPYAERLGPEVEPAVVFSLVRREAQAR